MEKATRSPLPESKRSIKPVAFTFARAVNLLIEGSKIHRLAWKDKKYYGFIENDILCLHKPDGKNHPWILNLGDLVGEDYIVL